MRARFVRPRYRRSRRKPALTGAAARSTRLNPANAIRSICPVPARKGWTRNADARWFRWRTGVLRGHLEMRVCPRRPRPNAVQVAGFVQLFLVPPRAHADLFPIAPSSGTDDAHHFDPSAAAVIKAFRDAGRPPLDTLSPVDARAASSLGRAIGAGAARHEAREVPARCRLTVRSAAALCAEQRRRRAASCSTTAAADH